MFDVSAYCHAGEDSLSHHVDYDVGVSIIDRFTYYMLDFFQGIGPDSKATVQDLIDHVRYSQAPAAFALSDHHLEVIQPIVTINGNHACPPYCLCNDCAFGCTYVQIPRLFEYLQAETFAVNIQL